jgi:hypothetical protein
LTTFSTDGDATAGTVFARRVRRAAAMSRVMFCAGIGRE